MNNLSEYFQQQHEFYLDTVSYIRIDKEIPEPEIQMQCKDTITARILDENSVVVTVTRDINFRPAVLFKLSVSYGAVLRFAPEKRDEVDWNEIDLSKEFQENGTFVTANLFNRISLLMGEITGAYGQSPMIIPPQFLANK